MSSLNPGQLNEMLALAGAGSTVHLVGAGGCGVSALGHLLLDAGHRVTGSDAVENEEVRQLRARGAIIHTGHAEENLLSANPILVVFSPAVSADNPELHAARRLGIPSVRRALLLAAFVQRQQGICVAGMHGKTTTSALLAFALEKLGLNPSYAVGALLPQMSRHARYVDCGDWSPLTLPGALAPGVARWAGAKRGGPSARSQFFVVEADESDGTLREFQPAHAILLNVDAEHLDHFPNIEAVCQEFELFAAHTRGTMVFCADDERLVRLMESRPEAVSYGFHELAQYRVESKVQSPKSKTEGAATLSAQSSTRFTVWHHGAKLGDFSIRLFGEKNISNATAVIALLHQLGCSPKRIASALAEFLGAARRQEELLADGQIRVFDDYGHHPTEVRATLAALKQLGARRLVVAFQPHRFSRTLHLMQDFATAFGDADKLFLTDVYAASEAPIPGADSVALAAALRAQGQIAEYVPALRDVPAALRAALEPGDLVLFLGAGDITKVAHEFVVTWRPGAAMKVPPHKSQAMSTPSSPTGIMEKLRAAVWPETVVRADEPLAKRTTMRVGGNADFYAEPASEADLSGLLKICAELKLPFVIIGRGSNLLIKDGGIRGLVISLGHDSLSRVQIIGEHLHCGAGAKLKTVAVEARRAGLAGLEFLEGIPGSVGGALRMNAGAMGAWMFEVVEQIRFMDFHGVAHERKASEVNVEYRGCPLFKTHIALGAVLFGKTAAKDFINERASTYNAKRWESQPAQPSAGCIFKNPASVPAGKLIEELGLKGTKRGGAMVSTVHGNFIVNEGGATARDVLELIEFIKQTARARRGIELETEVEIIGE